MIERLYINNFRSLENFELPIKDLPSALLIGKNGAGKSSIGMALQILQKIGRGQNRIRDLIKPAEMTRGRQETPVRIELDVRITGVLYSYRLALEFPKGFHELRVLEETFSVDGIAKFTRNIAEVRFPQGEGEFIPMGYDWHMVWLSAAQARSDNDPLDIFRKWLSRILILSPSPAQIDGSSTSETLHPSLTVDNLGDWWNGLIGYSPSAYSKIESFLKQLIPDFGDIKNPVIGKDAKALEVNFESKDGSMTLPFEALSDGEKIMVIWAMVIAANKAYGPVLCFWDEPDNYLAISEIGDIATDLRKAFKNGGQFLATSHNAETIRSFSDENTFVLFRRSHQEPTQIRSLSKIDYSGDLIAERMKRTICSHLRA